MTTQEFPHQHTAHCESGVMSTLLKYHGHNLDEAMIFGIAHALTFVWMPLIKLTVPRRAASSKTPAKHWG